MASLYLAYLVTGETLLLFSLLCMQLKVKFIPRQVPPLYAKFEYRIAHPLVFVLVVCIVGLVCYLVWQEFKSPRFSDTKLKICLFSIAFCFVSCVTYLNSDKEAFEFPFSKRTEYFRGIPTDKGLRQFLSEYTQLQPKLPDHARTHPPGPILVLWGLSIIVGRRVVPVSLASLALSCLAIIPLFNLAEKLYGRKTALLSCSLYALMPAVEFFGATSVDAFFALFLLAALATFITNLGQNRPPKMFLSGVLWAMTVLQSFNLCIMGLFLAAYFLGVYLVGRTSRKTLVKDASWVFAGFFGSFLVLYLATGFNIFSCFLQSWNGILTCYNIWAKTGSRPPGLRWLIGNPVAFLYFAGFPVTYLFLRQGLTELRGIIPLGKADLFALSTILSMIVFNFIFLSRGEAERICMFFYPFLAVLAAKRLISVSEDTSGIIATLLIVAAQTLAMECLLYTRW